MSFSLTIDGLDDLKDKMGQAGDKVRQEVKKAMVKSVNKVKNTAQTLAPYKTSTLRRSIYTDVADSGFLGTISQDSNIAMYGSFMEFGTAPHVIEPVNRKALYWKGLAYPVRRVNHPGTAPRPFMQPALENNIDNIKNYFTDAMQNVINFIANQ